MKRKDFGVKPLSLPQPVWIIATYDENGNPNAMNAAWGGISEENEIAVCLSPEHKTCENFKKTGAFTISMADATHIEACDYVGIASGTQVSNKLEVCGLTVTKSEKVNAPIINELAVCMECRVKSFDEDSCILLGEIVNVSVDEACMTDGKVDLKKVRPVCLDPFNSCYCEIGDKVADAFNCGMKFM